MTEKDVMRCTLHCTYDIETRKLDVKRLPRKYKKRIKTSYRLIILNRFNRFFNYKFFINHLGHMSCKNANYEK